MKKNILLDVSQNSPSFDLAISRYENNIFYINTLDFTISRGLQSFKDRVRDAANLLDKITKESIDDISTFTGK